MTTKTVEVEVKQDALQRARSAFVERGIVVTAELEAQAQAAYENTIQLEQKRLEEAEARKGKFRRMVDGWIAQYPAIQEGMIKVGNLIMALIKLVVVNGFASVIMFFSLSAEVLRVVAGLSAIEASPLVIWLISIVMVSGFLFLSFIKYYLEWEAGWVTPKKYKWSLRIVWQEWRYALGIGKDWAEADTSPAKDFIKVRKYVFAAVIFCAMYGSMAHAVAKYNGNWMSAIWGLLTESTLSEMAALGVNVLTTVAIAQLAESTSDFVASRARKLEEATFKVGDDKIAALAVKAAADVLMTYYEQNRHSFSSRRRIHSFTPPLLNSNNEVNERELNEPVNEPERPKGSGDLLSQVAAWILENDPDMKMSVQETLQAIQAKFGRGSTGTVQNARNYIRQLRQEKGTEQEKN